MDKNLVGWLAESVMTNKQQFTWKKITGRVLHGSLQGSMFNVNDLESAVECLFM